MKRILLTITTLFFVLSLLSCGKNEPIPNENHCTPTLDNSNSNTYSPTNTDDKTPPSKKISGEITAASVFSEGLAFVCLDGNKEKAYCIDKQGHIVFELENKIQSAMGEIFVKFQNGYALIDGGICNTKGEITYPKDVGATEFIGVALNGGYIIATRITADYSSSKQEMGVMNTDFEWVLEPSESIYEELSENLWTSSTINTESFYADGMIYFDGCKKYLNVNTGEISNSINTRLPSNTWIYYTDKTFRNTNEEIMVNLGNLDNIESTGRNNYKNGKVPVIFFNQQVGKRFWTLVDENGNFLFDPVEMVNFTDFLWSWIKFDGEHTVFYNSSVKKLSCFNGKGELSGELNIDNRPEGYIEDGVILIISGSMNSKKCQYYNTDFSPLF